MKKNILFFYSRYSSITNAVRDYVNAFRDHSRHRIHFFDLDSVFPDIDLRPFDCIIFNFCVWGHSLPTNDQFLARIRSFTGHKIAIFQDEYDYLLWRKKEVIEMKIDTIVTCVPPEYIQQVFHGEAFANIEFIHALTGYVPEYLLKMPPPKPFTERTWWIGYRSRPVPFHYGRLMQEKVIIGQRMREICNKRSIPANIETTEEARIYGPAWPDFIRDCRVVLGTESGSNVFDFNDTIKPAIKSYLDSHPDAGFEKVYDLFLAEHEENIKMNQVSPRIFEAIALGTGLVLFEGTYSNVVRPWEHYIPLKKDFGNIEEVLKALDDVAGLEAMTKRAYADVIASGKYLYRNYITQIDDCVSRWTKNRYKEYKPIYALMGWRDSNGGFIPANKWDLSSLTETPLKYSDYHQGLPTNTYTMIEIRWYGLKQGLLYIRYDIGKIKRYKCQQSVFHIVGWRNGAYSLEESSRALFPAIKDASLEQGVNIPGFIGNKYMLIHSRKGDLRRTFMFSFEAVCFYVNSFVKSFFHVLTGKQS